MVSKPINRGRTEKRKTVLAGPARGKWNVQNGTKYVKKSELEENHELSDASGDDEGVAEAGSDEDEATQISKTTAYSSLLDSLSASVPDTDRPRKRRKVSPSRGVETNAASDPVEVNGDVSETLATQAEEEAASAKEDVEEAGQSEDEDEATASDPYSTHFPSSEDSDVKSRVGAVTDSKWKTSINAGSAWKITTQTFDGAKAPSQSYKTVKDLPLKQRLREESASLDVPKGQEFSDVMSTMYGYQDLLYTSRTTSGPFFRDLASLHILNHVLKGRDRVLRNGARLAANPTIPDDDHSFRDQGFTRPKVLVLLETREQCYRWIASIMRFFAPEQRENWSRFEEGFHAESHLSQSMPDDYLDLFDGNADNDFRLAVKFTRKTVKLFASFYQADVLICSPLGLRRVIAHSDPKKRDHDFLSSIEVLVLDQTHAMHAQNWEHVTFCLGHLNQQPRDAHGTDFTRVKPWYLDGHAKYLRQTIIATSFLAPEINALFNSHCLNIAGRIKVQPLYDGAIQALSLPSGVKQTFSRFDSSSPSSDPDARFAYFSSAVLPAISKAASAGSSLSPAGIMVFIPSYLDFVRVRNFFAASTATENISFGTVSEYSTVTAARRARSHLQSGKHQVMLYSGRAHHFHRYRFKGLKRIVWYGLPDDEVFYQELTEAVGNTVDEGKAGAADVGCRGVFSKWDGMKLERIVGTQRVRQMLTDSGGDTYDFV